MLAILLEFEDTDVTYITLPTCGISVMMPSHSGSTRLHSPEDNMVASCVKTKSSRT